MNGPLSDSFQQRLTRLERESYRWKLVSALAAVGLATLVWTQHVMVSRGLGKVVEAEAFVVRDARGKVRAVLDADPAGAAGLALTDKDGKEHLGLGVAATGGMGVNFRDRDGNVRSGMGVLPDGRPFLIPRITLNTGPWSLDLGASPCRLASSGGESLEPLRKPTWTP